MQPRPTARSSYAILAIIFLVLMPATALLASSNQVMGEIHFEGKSKVEKTSGVWIDGQYVGYLKELKGNKRVLLLPGEHTVSVRQNGYQDFTQRVDLKPGQKLTLQVAMMKAPTGTNPAAWSTVKIDVYPPRAAVFLDGNFIGHVGEFEGLGRALLVAPGNHNIKIALPGYQTFDTQINPLAHQKVELKTTLLKNNGPTSDPSLLGNGSESAGQPPPPSTAPYPPRSSPASTSQVPRGTDPDRAPPPPPEPAPQR